MDTLRHRLRQLRKERGWTLKQTEEKSSVPLSYLSAIENGRRRAGSETLKKLADAFGDTADESKKLLSEFEECLKSRKVTEVISGPFATIINGNVIADDGTKISSFDIGQEIEQLLLVLGGCHPQQIIHDVVGKTDREISENGNRMSRGYVVKHDDSEFFIEISVARKEAS